MDHNNDLSTDDAVYMLLEQLKSDGTFDEFRRHCLSDIDAKPTFQNWKQRIESNVYKYLNNINYSPELNKNTIREKIRKNLFDGRETRDIEEGADRILNQVLVSKNLCSFEDKISIAVNDYLGIKNDTLPVELNGLKESNINLKNISEDEVNNVSNQKIDLILDTENTEETSPEFEPLTSLQNENSNGSISGLSDLNSIGSPINIMVKESHDANSNNGFETNKYFIENQQQTLLDNNGIIDHKNDSTNIIPENVTKISNNTEQFITNDSKLKSKHSSGTSRPTSSQEKSSTHRSKEHSSSSHRSRSREKNDIKKRKNSDFSKDRKNSRHNKHSSDSKEKSKKYKHDKKSYHDNHDKTLKRDRKDKKEKSASLCKEPKLLYGNKSDDESNAGGSSNQKSNTNKNKSSTSDKSKSSSSNHKSSRKDNGSKDVVDKPKDELSNNSDRLNLKCSYEEKNDLFTDNSSDGPKKWCEFRSSSITNDEQDAANVLLSISDHVFQNSYSENIIYVENPAIEISDKPVNTKEIELVFQNNPNQTKYNDNVNENLNLTISETIESTGSVCENSISNDVKSKNCSNENNESASKQIRQELVVDEKEIETLNMEVTSSSNVIQIADKCNSDNISKAPKLNELPKQTNLIKKRKNYENNESKTKKLRLSESNVTSSEINVPVIDTALLTIISQEHDQITNNCDTDTEINGPVNNFSNQVLHEKYGNSLPLKNYNSSKNDIFKGFSQSDITYPSAIDFLKKLMETKQEEINNLNSTIDDGFKGFTDDDDLELGINQDNVHSLLKFIESLGFMGFSDNDKIKCIGCKYVKEQLDFAKKQNEIDNQQKNIVSGKNGIQNGTSFNEVMEIIYTSNNDNDKTSVAVYSQPNRDIKKECPAVNDNNHDITGSENWMARQEMKYKLLPVKVTFERLMGIYSNDSKPLSSPPQIPSNPQKSK